MPIGLLSTAQLLSLILIWTDPFFKNKKSHYHVTLHVYVSPREALHHLSFSIEAQPVKAVGLKATVAQRGRGLFFTTQIWFHEALTRKSSIFYELHTAAGKTWGWALDLLQFHHFFFFFTSPWPKYYIKWYCTGKKKKFCCWKAK